MNVFPVIAAIALTSASTSTSSLAAAAPVALTVEKRLYPSDSSGEAPAQKSAEPSFLVDQSEPDPSKSTDRNDIVVTARHRNVRGDPLQKVNAKAFALTEAVDDAVVGPLALGYAHAVPVPLRSGLRNFLNNLHEPDVALNYLLQLKPGKAAETLGRFAINSTIGGAGLFDVAKRKPFKLPRRPNGFADTMGYYGVTT